MSKLRRALQNLALPVIGSRLFIISNPKLVIEQCKAGVSGSMPARLSPATSRSGRGGLPALCREL